MKAQPAEPVPVAQGIDPNPLATSPTKWRAEHCTTHHHACDCREWQHACDIEAMEARAESAESALSALMVRVEGLEAFAQEVMESWPEGAPDGADLQEFATKHGLLREVTMQGPCGENCGCTEFLSPEDWPAACYRKTSLLTGNPESDASIERLLAVDAGEEG